MRYAYVKWYVTYPAPDHRPVYHVVFKLPEHKAREYTIGTTSASMDRFCKVVWALYTSGDVKAKNVFADNSSITCFPKREAQP